jgi:hypothetical protein
VKIEMFIGRAIPVHQVPAAAGGEHDRLVALLARVRDRRPLGVALAVAHGGELGEAADAARRLHPVGLTHQELEAVDRIERFEAIARRGRVALRDHLQHVDPDREALRDDLDVAVVARIGAQLRHAAPQVADNLLARLPEAGGEQQRAHGDHEYRRARSRGGGEPAPQRVAHGLVATPASLAGCQAHVREQDRQQDLVGEDHERHAHRGGDHQLLHHLDLHEGDHEEADRVGEQRGCARDEELTNAIRAAARPSRPRRTSSFHALVICTAWLTPMEKMRNGTRIDIGSSVSPMTGSSPSSQTTGVSATAIASAVSFQTRNTRRAAAP